MLDPVIEPGATGRAWNGISERSGQDGIDRNRGMKDGDNRYSNFLSSRFALCIASGSRFSA
ncbi:hypothetical protein [Sulfurifustis variabilis]|uniref:hypothetical protein n=1 Tax=Sulfurifustis variabilis TaxID=1675686 RepID=UPI0011E4CC59|nr:hypothetical protein [Sulfurifustis variabilis]